MKLEKYENGYILKNRKLELWMNKSGKADKLLYKGKNLIEHLDGNVVDPDRHNSFYLDYHQDLKSAHPQYTKFIILKDDDTCKHLVWIDDKSDLNLEYHLIMNSDDSKLYSYVIARNKTQKTYKINEMRTVYRLDKSIFPYSKTSSRQGLQPSSNYTNQFKKIQDETYEMPDGEKYSNSKIYSKYDYADYFKNNSYWGFFGQEYGFWFVPISKDYYPSGPLKQELMVHYDGILLNYMNGAHFGTSDFTIYPGWEKFYGPWAIYINEGNNKFVDVSRFAEDERRHWPFTWVKNDLYPLKRFNVSGRINLHRNYKLTVVLSQGKENFSKASAGYIYYADTDENGLFSISNVRKGTYKLTAFTCEGDLPGEFIKDDIVIDSKSNQDKNIDLGNIDFKLNDNYNILWQIGTASHTTEPFKFNDQLRNTIWRFLVPKNLDFDVQNDKDRDDWFAIQPYGGCWNIHFNVQNMEKKKYLTIALAGASKTKADHENDRGHGDPMIAIKLNNNPISVKYLLDDNAVYRNAIRNGSYHLIKLDLPADLLKKDNNILSLSTNGYLMYDTILLTEDR